MDKTPSRTYAFSGLTALDIREMMMGGFESLALLGRFPAVDPIARRTA
jgi:hypothetical protein